jgi:hypothetical protein
VTGGIVGFLRKGLGGAFERHGGDPESLSLLRGPEAACIALEERNAEQIFEGVNAAGAGGL